MTNRCLIGIVLACLLGAASAQTAPRKTPARRAPAAPPVAAPNSGNDEQDLVDMERHILDFIRAKDAKNLEPWIAEDFQYNDVAGTRMDREQFLSLVKSVQGEIEWLSADDIHVRVMGDVAILTGVQQSRISSTPADVIPPPGAPPPVTTRTAFTDVFRRRGSSWELVMVYAALLEAPPAPPVQPAQPAAKPPEKPAEKPRGEDDPPPLRKPPGAR